MGVMEADEAIVYKRLEDCKCDGYDKRRDAGNDSGLLHVLDYAVIERIMKENEKYAKMLEEYDNSRDNMKITILGSSASKWNEKSLGKAREKIHELLRKHKDCVYVSTAHPRSGIESIATACAIENGICVLLLMSPKYDFIFECDKVILIVPHKRFRLCRFHKKWGHETEKMCEKLLKASELGIKTELYEICS